MKILEWSEVCQICFFPENSVFICVFPKFPQLSTRSIGKDKNKNRGIHNIYIQWIIPKNRFESVQIAALRLYNIQRENLVSVYNPGCSCSDLCIRPVLLSPVNHSWTTANSSILSEPLILIYGRSFSITNFVWSSGNLIFQIDVELLFASFWYFRPSIKYCPSPRYSPDFKTYNLCIGIQIILISTKIDCINTFEEICRFSSWKYWTFEDNLVWAGMKQGRSSSKGA